MSYFQREVAKVHLLRAENWEIKELHRVLAGIEIDYRAGHLTKASYDQIKKICNTRLGKE